MARELQTEASWVAMNYQPVAEMSSEPLQPFHKRWFLQGIDVC